jgi:flagellar biosynthesis GTPase FlhF
MAWTIQSLTSKTKCLRIAQTCLDSSALLVRYPRFSKACQQKYKEHKGKFRLDVTGIDPVDELKRTVTNVKRERDEAKEKARILEEQRIAAEEERLREKSEFKELYEREKSAAQKMKEDWEAEKAATNKEKIHSAALEIAAALGNKESSVKLLTREAKDYISIDAGKIKYEIGGIEVDKQAVMKMLLEEYANICKSSGANGGGAAGGKNGGAGKKLSDMTQSERLEFKKRDPEGFRRALTK